MEARGRSKGRWTRRDWLAGAATWSAGMLLPAAARAGHVAGTLRIGLTPVFLDDQIGFIAQWRRWFEARLERPVVFVQRGNYREIIDLLLASKIDFAWLCGYPYVRHRRRLRLAAVPLWRGRPLYQSYLIVSADGPRYKSLADLRGKVFAFSDPDSNSGYLYPQYALRVMGENPAAFFARTFFTWSHRTVVEAVGIGLADGGAVDGYVWEALAGLRPELTQGARVIDKSPPLGFPPFVARGDIAEREWRAFRAALFDMATDGVGVGLLGKLALDGFVAAEPGLYDGIARMLEKTHGA